MMQVARSLATLALALVIASCGTAGPTESPAGPASSVREPAASTLAPAATADPSASPADGDMTAAEIEQLLAEVVVQPIDVSDPGPALDRAEEAMKDYMREATGIAELLGADGPAILAGIDTTGKEALAALVAEVRAQAVAPGTGAVALDVARSRNAPLTARLASVVTPAAPDHGEWNPHAEGEAMFGVLMLTMSAPGMFATLERDASGNSVPPPIASDTRTKHGETVHTTMQPTLIGSKLTFKVRIDVAAGEPLPYEEETTGTLTVDLCPDANGSVPLELSLSSKSSLLGGGMQFKVAVTATGHTDDSGRLASLDLKSDGSLASQPLKGHGALGTAPMYAEMSVGYTVAMDGSASTNVTASSPRQSSQVNRAFLENAFSMIALGRLAVFAAMGSAEDKWTNGYCLEIAVPSMDAGGSRSVATGSTTPFTANVRHKFEGADLAVPVSATLGSGGVSVSPSGTKVPAPARFSYLAPDKDRQTATVNLETRSKRGVATLAVTFMTASPGWVLRGPGGAILGKKCDGVGGDWIEELTVPSLGMTNTWVFTIDETTLKGTYTMDAVQDLKDGSGTWHGTGEASVTLGPDGTAEISLTGGKTTITTKTSGGTATQTAPGPEGQHSVWMPAGDACR
jgi:hypothetical protein